jgi:ubiquinone/menaquinone biosynthesis C-methylase UbiE
MRMKIYLSSFVLVGLLMFSAGAPDSYALQLGGREAPEWIEVLERPARIEGLMVDEVVSRMQLKPGMVVADVGAGSGVFIGPFAKAVGSSGKVYAVDIEQGLLDHINQRARQENLSNIRTVLGKFEDPSIPANDVDMAFIHDVLHHIEKREAYLKALASYIKPGGMLTIIDMDPSAPDTPHAGNPELLVSRADADKWLASLGFRPAKVHSDLFPGEKWFVVYQKQ